MRKALFSGLLLLAASQAQADYQCNVHPQDDIVITPAQVEITGASGNLTISPQGDIRRNGAALQISAASRQQAVAYQQALRNDLPWIDRGARERLEQSRVALDNIVVEKLGKESNVRQRLTTLDSQLKQQMNRIIEHRSDGLAFHHQAIGQVRQQGDKLIQSAMGGVLQDSLNEMGRMKSSGGENPLQAIMGNLGGLQQSIQAEWHEREQDFSNFGHQVCQKVTGLETQRKALLAGIK